VASFCSLDNFSNSSFSSASLRVNDMMYPPFIVSLTKKGDSNCLINTNTCNIVSLLNIIEDWGQDGNSTNIQCFYGIFDRGFTNLGQIYCFMMDHELLICIMISCSKIDNNLF